MSEASTPAPVTPPQDAPRPPKNNYGWILFFSFIVVASVGVTWFMIWFNLSIQLTPEKLDEARQLWNEKGPKSYNMVYTKRLNDDARLFTYVVSVRKGKVVEVLENGRALEKTPEREDDPLVFHSMDAIFRDLERNMTMDQKPGAKRVYVTAIFDDQTGCVRKYIRRVMGETVRIEMHVTIEVVD